MQSHLSVQGPKPKDSVSKDIPLVSFRRYAPGDIQACARMARDAWPAGPRVAAKDSELAGMEEYMEYSLSVSNYTDMAYTDDGPVGFLFGRIDGHPGKPAPRRPTLGEVPSIIGASLRNGATALAHLGFVWSILLTNLKLMLYTPRSDAAIEMFIVSSEHRGKGVGSALLERYLKSARDAEASLVTVYTDERMSDWRFYERKGFRRVRTFHDNITSHYSGAYTRGIIYALELGR